MDPSCVELIAFQPPRDEGRSLYVSCLPANMDSGEMWVQMNLLFSQFGLVHDIHIPVSDHIASALPSPQPTTLGYGFVKFYSLSAASSAQQGLDRRGKIGGRSLRVQFAARRQAPLPSSHHLYHPKCQELANHYLGFNSWSVSIVSMVTCEDGGGGGKVCYQCSVQLTLRLCECVSVGVGRGEAQVLSPTERAKVIGTAKKLAYRRACENAFSKVIIAVLPSGKAIPEVVQRPIMIETQCPKDSDVHKP